MKERQRFDRPGLLAIEPKAFFCFFEPPAKPENQTRGNVCTVTVRGPLDHHSGLWTDSYEEICGRVAEACAGPAENVVLKLDSPGGVVAGCFESAYEIRKLCARAGKRLIAYVDGQACSAAYALACAAEQIVMPKAAFVGSVGVIEARADVTAMNAEYGLRYAITRSGARKGDGHPDLAISDDELAAAQKRVDDCARIFFGWVAESRGLTPDQVAAHEAGVFQGVAAVNAALADQTLTFDELVEALEAGTFGVEQTMKATKEYQDARAALEKIAEGQDEEEAKKAKKALAALNEEEEEEAEGDEEEPEAEDDTPAEDDEEEPSVKAARPGLAVKAVTKVDQLAKRVSQLERQQVSDFLGSQKWLSKEARALLKDEPLAKVKKMVAAMKPSRAAPAAAAAATGTPGAGQVATSAEPGPAATSFDVDGQTIELSQQELSECKRRNLDPAKYAATRAAIRARSTHARTEA